MFAARERLGQLLALAAERRWTPLARELCDLILYWPADFPEAMRGPIMALFETALCESDEGTQSELAQRLAGHSEMPLRLMNVLYLTAPGPLRREILMRNELEGPDVHEHSDAEGVLAIARRGARDFAGALAEAASIPRRISRTILADTSGESLAVLCRGLGLSRAVFSAIALLRGTEPMPLEVYDTVPDHAAACLVHDWRKRIERDVPAQVQAAE